MANQQQNFPGIQADIFQRLDADYLEQPEGADLDVAPELLGAINTALRMARQRGMSRERVIDRMNALLPDCKKLTKRQLDKWTAKSTEYSEFPARYLPAFCAATECDAPLRALALSLGLDLADQRVVAASQLGENLIQSAALRNQRRSLTSKLGGL